MILQSWLRETLNFCRFCFFFLPVYTTVSLPFSHLHSLPLQRFWSRWGRLKRGQTLSRPPDPQPREPPVSHAFFFFHSFTFFFPRTSLSSVFFLFHTTLSHQESSLPESIFLSLLLLTCSSSVRKCPLRSYLYSYVGHRNTFIDLWLVIMYTKGCWFKESVEEVTLQGAFFFIFQFITGLITSMSCHAFLLFVINARHSWIEGMCQSLQHFP